MNWLNFIAGPEKQLLIWCILAVPPKVYLGNPPHENGSTRL